MVDLGRAVVFSSTEKLDQVVLCTEELPAFFVAAYMHCLDKKNNTSIINQHQVGLTVNHKLTVTGTRPARRIA